MPRDIAAAKRIAKVVSLFSATNDGEAFAAELLKHERDPRVVWVSRERDFLHNMKRSRTAPTALQEKWLRDISNRRRAA